MLLRRYCMMALPIVIGACGADQLTESRGVASILDQELSTRRALFDFEVAAGLNGDQQERISRILGRATTGEMHLALLNSDIERLLETGQIAIQLSPSEELVAVRDLLVRHPTGRTSWRARTDDKSGTIHLVRGPSGVYGVIRTLTDLYQIEPVGSGVHAIVRVNQAMFPPEGGVSEASTYTPPELAPTEQTFRPALQNQSVDGLSSSPRAARELHSRAQLQSFATSLANYSGYGNVDVLVAYTAAAAAQTADIEDHIQLAVDITNTTYSDSYVNFSVGLVHTVQVSYNETNRTFSQHVAALQSMTDGMMDDLHSLRNQYLADVVLLLVDDLDDPYCGLASTTLANASSAFAASRWDCATGNFTFAHEGIYKALTTIASTIQVTIPSRMDMGT